MGVRADGFVGSTGSLKRKSASLGKLGFSRLSVIGIILTQTTSPIDHPVEEPFTSYFYLCLKKEKVNSMQNGVLKEQAMKAKERVEGNTGTLTLMAETDRKVVNSNRNVLFTV